MKKIIYVLTITFLTISPLAAIEGKDPRVPKRIKREEGLIPLDMPKIKLEFQNDDALILENTELDTLKKSVTIKNMLAAPAEEKDLILIPLRGFGPNITKDEFEIVFDLLKHPRTIENFLENQTIDKLSRLWEIIDFLDIPSLLSIVTPQLKNRALASTKESAEVFYTIYKQIPPDILNEKTAFPFDRSNKVFENLGRSSQDFNRSIIVKLKTFPFSENYEIYSLSFNPQGTLLAAGFWNGAVYFYDTSDINDIKNVAGFSGTGNETEENQVFNLSFNQNGTRLIASDVQISTYKITSDNKIKRGPPIISEEDDRTAYLALMHPTKDIVAVSFVRSGFSLYEISQENQINELYSNPNISNIQAVAFNPQGTLVALGLRDGNIIFYDITNPSQPHIIRTLKSAENIKSLAFNAQGSRLASAAEDNVIIYNISNINEIFRINTVNTDSSIENLAWNKKNILTITNTKGEILFYDTSNLFSAIDPVIKIQTHTNETYALALNQEKNLMASGGIDRKIHIYDISALTNLTFDQVLLIMYLINHPQTDLNKLPEEFQEIFTSLDSSIQTTLSFLKILHK